MRKNWPPSNKLVEFSTPSGATVSYCTKFSLFSSAHATLQSYTPKYLAQEIFTSRTALEGECKQVRVLFPDLKGTIEVIAKRDPEEASRILD